MPTKPTPSNIAALMEHNKNHLYAILQRLFPGVPVECTYDEFGPCHEPAWQCTICLDKKPIGLGGGTTMQDASEGAALSAIGDLHRRFHKQNPSAFR
ncbi:hypothetical protein K443DRAFT_7436 [Laccaria amethystina LaAM-08-1]|uniref:DRBM domain-containing protein n=1 Tax=Laccaria amethystina LaAM-08-1 TaxID=1095629 RepID=A0A0C9WQV0_9AGAR|nr:hypothetical protein K443DRAFT_7436 [Laccaria amethystina LaAM-08-1]